jgi:hypothetical protein
VAGGVTLVIISSMRFLGWAGAQRTHGPARAAWH